MSKEKEIEKVFNILCKEVVSLDNTIRFAGISDEDGKLKSIAERPGLNPLLTTEERVSIRNYCCYKAIYKIEVGIYAWKNSLCKLQL